MSAKVHMGEEDNLVRDFEKETNTLLDAEEQIKYEERENKHNIFTSCNESDIIVKVSNKKD